MSDEPTEQDVEACPIKWCGFPMPHEHTQGSGPTWTDLLNDPDQQLDKRGEVLARVRVASLTTAQREWLDHAALYGNLHEVVETLLAQARREGAADAWDEGAQAAQEWETRDLDGPSGDPPRNPYRGDA